MEELILTLQDAGCDPQRISEICQLYAHGDTQSVIKRLRRHRYKLMDTVHESQKKVDCLDLLLRELSKQPADTV